jgi:hypothetical protein
VVVSLFVLGLCITPFAIAAPAQQNKMKTCNAEAIAKGLGEGKGDERESFMKECLSAKPAKAGGTQGWDYERDYFLYAAARGCV